MNADCDGNGSWISIICDSWESMESFGPYLVVQKGCGSLTVTQPVKLITFRLSTGHAAYRYSLQISASLHPISITNMPARSICTFLFFLFSSIFPVTFAVGLCQKWVVIIQHLVEVVIVIRHHADNPVTIPEHPGKNSKECFVIVIGSKTGF